MRSNSNHTSSGLDARNGRRARRDARTAPPHAWARWVGNLICALRVEGVLRGGKAAGAGEDDVPVAEAGAGGGGASTEAG